MGSRSAGALTERERRQQWVSLGILLAPWVLGFMMEATPDRATFLGLEGPPCPSRLVTEHGCPGCGLTRSVVFTLNGALDSAWAVHPAGPAILVLCLLGAGLRGDILLRGRMTDLHARLFKWGHMLFAGIVLVSWFGRILVKAC